MRVSLTIFFEANSPNEPALKAAFRTAMNNGIIGSPADKNTERTISQLIQKLGDDDFDTRAKAMTELRRYGPIIEKQCVDAIRRGPEIEVAKRLEQLLENVDQSYYPNREAFLQFMAWREVAPRFPGEMQLRPNYEPWVKEMIANSPQELPRIQALLRWQQKQRPMPR
jgi:hypothetical protein